MYSHFNYLIMKNLIIILALLTGFVSSAQTIRIADNNATRPTGPNIYATLQLAINAAAPGDLVYVQPSPTSYGNATVDRPITLRGIGFNTGKDIGLPSTVGDITLTNTLTNSTNASGTTIEGVTGNRIFLGTQTGIFTYTLQNITISNCSLAVDGIYRVTGYMVATNITIQNCSTGIWFNGTGTVSQLFIFQNYLYQIVLGGPGSLASTIISNNFTDSGNSNQFGATAFGANLLTNSLLITNNNFLGEANVSGTHLMQYDLHDAVVSNNIFYGCAPNGPGSAPNLFERNAFNNNLSFGTTADALPPAGTGVGNTGANNKVSVDPKFVNAPFNTLWAATMDFTLQAGSPALLAGSDGTDIGITGGAYPVTSGNFKLSTPHAPIIMTLNPAAVVPQNQPIITNIKAKSN